MLIDEVHYNPPGSDETEFIEFRNRLTNAVNLAGAVISDAVDFVFPEENSVVEGGARIVVVEDLDGVEAKVKAAGYHPHNHGDYEPGRRFYFDGPDNIEIEVVSYA